MADIINTAMEEIGCVASSGFWRVNCDEFLCYILCTFTWKWVTWMHFILTVVILSSFYDFRCCKVDESCTKETDNVIVQKALACPLLYMTKLQNDIKVESLR